MKQLSLFDLNQPLFVPIPLQIELEPIVNPELEMAIHDAIYRIRREYNQTEGRIYLSFSGGKDSTVLATLIQMAKLPHSIPFVFSNTGVEFSANIEFVQNYDYDNLHVVKPKMPFSQVIEKYGKPCISKLQSGALNTYQRHIDHPFEKARSFQLLTGMRIKNWKLTNGSGRTNYRLANKNMQFLHPDTEFKISNQCCKVLKKAPLERYVKENGMKGVFLGVRMAEGGVRAITYTSCVEVGEINGEPFYSSKPIIDWSDALMEQFIEYYHVPLSKVYTEYGLKRSGCVGCPYGRNVKQELKVLYDFEPNRYKAMMKWMSDVYMYQGIECTWDESYMEEYRQRFEVIEYRRQFMIQHFRNPIKQKFLSLFSGSIFAKKKSEKFNLAFNEMLELIEEGEIPKERFDNCYTTLLKPASASHAISYWSKKTSQWITEVEIEEILSGDESFYYLKLITKVNTFQENPLTIEGWKEEYISLPGFYQTILANQVSTFIE